MGRLLGLLVLGCVLGSRDLEGGFGAGGIGNRRFWEFPMPGLAV